MDQNGFDRLRLARSPRIGPVTWASLIARFGSASEALRMLPDLAKRGGANGAQVADEGTVAREAERVSALGASYLFLDDRDYPPLLGQIDTAPPVLIVRGDMALLERRCVGMVGARNASAAACRFARMLAQDLTREEVVVVSGLARGIDTAAHVGSLMKGTIGVIASGIDIAFPPENAQLQEDVATHGLLIAEQPPGAEPRARNFPYRNRIIAGLSLGTVVVEAAPKSGSLITARLAAEAGREVMAVPGSPLDPRAQGCNLLIREGATLVQSAADVIEAISHLDDRMVRSPTPHWSAGPIDSDVADGDRKRLHALLGPVPVQVDELVRQAGLAPAIVQTVLLELELAGRLERHAGGRVSLA
ncbi:DNA-processing protein DprA [Sphingobium subterraneum]|uniref:DNA-processing protein DprA n=1 Tax=Sphingobium subterraneum TaxID=627688 RepID=UPI0031B5F23A